MRECTRISSRVGKCFFSLYFLLVHAMVAQGLPVTVMDPGNDPLALTVEAADTILELKEEILTARGYPVEEQVLVYDGSRLADSSTIEENAIVSDGVLYLTLETGEGMGISNVTLGPETLEIDTNRMTMGISHVLEHSPELTDPAVWNSEAEIVATSAADTLTIPAPEEASAFYRVRERNPRPPVTQYEGYELIWHDEFEGPDINPENWEHHLGDGSLYGLPPGWGNAEMQIYTAEPANSSIVGDGEGNSVLLIQGQQDPIDGGITSAKLVTQDLQSFRYGRIEARIRLPFSKGAWPAFWMLGINQPIVPWPGCGEIDIMEMLGGEEDTIHGTVFYIDADRQPGGSTDFVTNPSGLYSDAYHIYRIDWTPTEITWSVDGVPYHTTLLEDDMKEFQRGFYLILNLAVGGFWPGNPDRTSVFPMRMFVDWVRAYRDVDLVDPGEPALDVEEETIDVIIFDGSAAIKEGFEPFQNLATKTWGPGAPEGMLSFEAVDGTYSVLDQWKSNGYGGMWWVFTDPLDANKVVPQDLSAYEGGNLVMALKVPETVAFYFEVKLESSGPFGKVNLLDYTPVPLSGGFAEYTIPLADFTSQGFDLTKVTIPLGLWNPQSEQGVYVDAEVLIDNVHWTLP
ncbi:MAG: family 16 glycosylhydrolase [Puniceicoccaceae bacterium]